VLKQFHHERPSSSRTSSTRMSSGAS
jgi:hypothetical protein